MNLLIQIIDSSLILTTSYNGFTFSLKNLKLHLQKYLILNVNHFNGGQIAHWKSIFDHSLMEDKWLTENRSMIIIHNHLWRNFVFWCIGGIKSMIYKNFLMISMELLLGFILLVIFYSNFPILFWKISWWCNKLLIC